MDCSIYAGGEVHGNFSFRVRSSCASGEANRSSSCSVPSACASGDVFHTKSGSDRSALSQWWSVSHQPLQCSQHLRQWCSTAHQLLHNREYGASGTRVVRGTSFCFTRRDNAWWSSTSNQRPLSDTPRQHLPYKSCYQFLLCTLRQRKWSTTLGQHRRSSSGGRLH